MLSPSSEEEWQRARAEIDAPLAAMAAFGTRSREEWQGLGWPLVIDPFSGQVLAYQAMRDAFARFQEDGTSGHPIEDVYRVYSEIKEAAGMGDLYAIEERSTEKPG